MGKALDLTGQKFGELTVIEKSQIRKSNRITWHCKCSCGKEVDVIGNSLTAGHTKSCGHLQKQAASKINPALNLSGKKFGKLTVLQRDKSRGKHTYWICKCDCGNTVSVRTNSLVTGHTKSCGCINSNGEEMISNWLIKHNINFVRQKTFDSCINQKTNYLLKFDFFIDNKFLLEYDGITHFKATGGWNDSKAVKEQQYRDELKNQWCLKNNIPLYRISYKDIYNAVILDLTLKNILKENM